MRNGGGSLLRSVGRNALCGRQKSSLGKPLVKIESENIVAVGGHAKVGVGLAGSRSHDSQQLVLLKSMNSVNGQRSDSCLLAFLDGEADEQISFFAFVIIFHVRRDSGIQKAVCLIQSLHGLRICIHQPPAESSWRTKGAPENLQPALQQFRVEVFATGDRDSHKLALV